MDMIDKREFLAGAFGVTAIAGLAPSMAGAETKADDGRERFNVRSFGAKGDGKTPDTAAIQSAIDAAAKVKGTVYFPPGEYPCHDLKARPNVTLLGDPVWIFRDEKAGAVLQLDDPGAKCLVDITASFGVRIRGLLLNGIRQTPKPVHGIHLDNPKKWSPKEDTICIDDVKVQNFSGHGIFLDRIWLFIIRHSQCFGNGGCGCCIRGWDGFVTDNQFSGNGSHGFGCLDCGATVMFTANRVEWNGGYGLYVTGGDAWNVTGNSFDRNWGAGLCFDHVSASAVTGNLFRRCGKDSNMLAEGEKSCQVRLFNSRGISFTGNTCKAGRDDGGKGKFTPQIGFHFKGMSYSVVSANALAAGYMEQMTFDEGGYGPDFIVKDNVGYPCNGKSKSASQAKAMTMKGAVSLALAALMVGATDGENLRGCESWAGLKAHPAVVNPVGRPADDPDTVSLRGEWDFRTSNQRTRGNGPGGRVACGESAFWTAAELKECSPLRKVQVPGCWEMQGVGEAATGMPCFVRWDVSPKPLRHVYWGSAWYRKSVKLPAAWAGKRIWLKTGWTGSLGRFWVNGEPVAYERSYVATHKYDVTDFVKPGEETMVVAEVVNDVSSRNGLCSVNHWGGILRDIEFEATPSVCFIDDAWVRGDFDGRRAEVKVKVEGERKTGSFSLRVTVEDATREVSLRRSPSPTPYDLTLGVPLRDFRPWSPEHPNLYWAKIELLENGKVVQTRRERFGVRKLEVRGKEFYLNGKPFYFRGAGWHAVHPIEGYPKADRAIWLKKAQKIRAAGFNIVRNHTHCNMPEFFEACDEVGLMVQPELPYYTDIPRDGQEFDPLGDAEELYRSMRRHPSFAVYSGGNEGLFGPRLTLRLYREIRERDPDRLMVGQDTWLNKFNNQPGMSDFSGGPMTVWPRGSVNPDMPFVCHEYLNLCVKLDSRLEPKYTGVYEPPVTRKGRATWLARFGLDHVWGDRLQDAQNFLQRVWRKYGFESARLDPYCDGYSYWSLQDYASPQKGTYTGQALFDPFWDEKPCGDRAADVAVYNSPSCLLLADGNDPELWGKDPRVKKVGFAMFADSMATNRVRVSGECVRARFHLQHYGDEPLKDAALEWMLVADGSGAVLAKGVAAVGDQVLGPTRMIASADIAIPAITNPTKAVLTATLTHRPTSHVPHPSPVSNSWEYWLFPNLPRPKAPADVTIVAYGSKEMDEALAAGRKVVALANQTGAPDIFVGWWWMGEQMGAALCEHPSLRHLPHGGMFSPLFFRIGKTGLELPVEGVAEKDLIMVGEGAETCRLYLSKTVKPNGAVLFIVAGLDVTTNTPEGNAILRGVYEDLMR